MNQRTMDKVRRFDPGIIEASPKAAEVVAIAIDHGFQLIEPKGLGDFSRLVPHPFGEKTPEHKRAKFVFAMNGRGKSLGLSLEDLEAVPWHRIDFTDADGLRLKERVGAQITPVAGLDNGPGGPRNRIGKLSTRDHEMLKTGQSRTI
ncbi:MAG: hypothetical protein V1875_09740 [Candidatus Altiarchaeota archaeon]